MEVLTSVVLVALVIASVAALQLVLWLKRMRCPGCRRHLQAEVLSSDKVAKAKWKESVIDKKGRAREKSFSATAHYVKKRCRSCGHHWERLETR